MIRAPNHPARYLRLLWAAAFLVPLAAAASSTDDEVNRVLASSQAPDGIVFEIVTNRADTLRWAVPAVRRYAAKLRKRFPKLPIAVVSHGDEEFALTKANRNRYRKVHQGIQSLRADNIPVTVCEAYAEMHKVSPQDFPDYVEIAPTGPSEIRAYREFGYHVIRVERPEP
jgi:intracellular sulfur oxidation DsrE/DsrF family protein